MNFKIYLQLKKLYQANDFEKLLKDSNSLMFLKIRSIARKALLVEFADKIKIDPHQGTNDLIEEIANNPETEKVIDNFIDSKFQDEIKERRKYQDKLISELYKLQVFDWGGLYQNNLERTIVDNYIKKIKNFDTLMDKVDNEIHESLKGYVLCSWFNHWTSILIEDIFKEHKRVLPANGFMALKRKEKGLKPELTELKRIARENKINFDSSQKNKLLIAELLTRLSESHLEPVKKAISNFHKTRWKIIEETMKNKKGLIRWLYEEQGERRFDSANRLFLVLIDKENLGESWKLKRNIDFLKESVSSYLDKFKINDDLKIVFDWQDEKYTSISDALFIVK
ncbi:MAG: hypothetical protein HQ536_01645 [Parcubacteria group bacterium]|nr:hypothetical protein [Parcubacteria group bacterium]